MSSSPITRHKRNQITHIKSTQEDNNNKNNKFTERQQAKTFIAWYKCMIDDERTNLVLYLADDVSLEWFGRTIKTRKKVGAFLKHDMQCSRHDFTTVESIDKMQSRQERVPRIDDSILPSPLTSPEIISMKSERPGKRRLLRSNCNSPEWAEGCQPEDDRSEIKRAKANPAESSDGEKFNERQHGIKRLFSDETEINNKGDGVLGRRIKRKCVPVTPPNVEVGQGDCLPSTSTDSNRSQDTLNAQLQKLAVECNGYIEFTRSRNSRNIDSMKWERKCKMQISYSEDPLNVGEYIIWALRYTDESKCRRNLLAAFEEVAKGEELKNV